MDDIFAWAQAKLGPVTFGAILGFVLQIIIFRPKSWMLALERAIAAVAMPILFAKPVASLVGAALPTALDRETLLTVVAGTLSLGGIELLRAYRSRVVKTVEGKDDE
jgi:hypothetical protein